jgi:hypothetical protein
LFVEDVVEIVVVVVFIFSFHLVYTRFQFLWNRRYNKSPPLTPNLSQLTKQGSPAATDLQIPSVAQSSASARRKGLSIRFQVERSKDGIEDNRMAAQGIQTENGKRGYALFLHVMSIAGVLGHHKIARGGSYESEKERIWKEE